MSSLNDSSTRSLHIVSGSSNVKFTSPNIFTLQLPSSGFRAGRDECALKSLTMYYSWPNVSSTLGNNSFSYTFNGVEYPVVLETGIWQFDQIQAYLEQVMRQNGHYLVDDSGDRKYFISLAVNSVLYCLSLTMDVVPSTLPTGWTNPAGMALTGSTLTLNIPSSMANLTGFAAASYPAVSQSTMYQVNSGIPQITGVTALNLTSNIVTSSGLSLNSNILASFVVPDDQGPGTLIQVQPSNLDWVAVHRQSTFTEIEVAVVDQLMRPVDLRDTAGFVCILNIRRCRA